MFFSEQNHYSSKPVDYSFNLVVFDLQGQTRIWSCKECQGVRNALWGLFRRGHKGCILRTMDAINMKGLKHLVVVFLDLNFQTTAPAIRGRQQMELRGARSNKIDVCDVNSGIMQHKT